MPYGLIKNCWPLPKKGGYAVEPSTSIILETLQAIVSAGEARKIPCRHCRFRRSHWVCRIAIFLFLWFEQPLVRCRFHCPFHLDHGKDLEIIRSCIENGFTFCHDRWIASRISRKHTRSSHKKKVVAMARKKRGLRGGRVEGWRHWEIKCFWYQRREAFSDRPSAAEELCKKTEVRCFWPLRSGTSHGAYKFKGKSNLTSNVFWHRNCTERSTSPSCSTELPVSLHRFLEKRNDLGG